MSILSGKEIQKQIKLGTIKISSFNEKFINPVSYDLTLGDTYTYYKEDYMRCNPTLDTKTKNKTCGKKIIPESGLICNPNFGYLMYTKEKIWTNKYVPIIDGKSSLGRLFVFIHVTAGYGEPGFNGNYTLEIICKYSTILYPGMRIAQIRFMTIEGEIEQYNGHYTGKKALGAIASRSYEQFIKE